MKRFLGAIAALAVIGAGVGLASPASADEIVNLSVRNGTVGVSQVIDAQVQTTGFGGEGTVTFTAGGSTIGTDTVGPTQGYNAQVNWTPAVAGRSNVTATFSGGGSDSTSVLISTVSTTTSIASPGSAAAGSTIGLTAQVRSKSGSYVPTGKITFYLSNGKSIGTSNVNGQGVASLDYQLPSSNGKVSFYAQYNGDSNADGSKPSSTTTTQVTAQGSSVALVVPQTNYLNSSVPLSASISPNTGTGTVTFTVDRQTVGTANVTNGTASVTWVPISLGNPKVIATYSGGNGVTGSSDSKTVAVIQPLKADAIAIDPGGPQGPILNNAVYVMANGQTVQASVTAASGLPVTIAIVGPCAWDGSSFSVKGVGGNCTVTATTNGGNGYAPAKLVFAVSTSAGAQTAKVSAPKSGTYKKGKKLTLAKALTVTNLNKPITWKVTKGGSYCKIARNSNGAVLLKLVKVGKCTVTGSAPAVSGQWTAYHTSRNYRVK